MQQTLIGVLNASGISLSYAIDLKDCKYARQLWKFFVIVTYWCSMSYINLCFMSCRFTFDVVFWNGVFVLIPVMYVTHL